MYTHSNDALAVIRLVLRQSTRPPPATHPKRHLTTVLPLRDTPLYQSENLYFSSTSANTAAEIPDFLEQPSAEYSRAVRHLPFRRNDPKPIPWPTLFAHNAKPKINAQQDHSEPLYQLVRSKDYTSARRVLHELKEHKIAVPLKEIYLEPAIACLYASPMDEAGFWEWLALYPPRPATQNHAGLKRKWSPIIRKLLWCHPNDPRILISFLHRSAGKGLLPTTFIPLIYHLTFRLPPHESLQAFRKAVDIYYSVAASPKSSSERALYNKGIVDAQVDVWWNRYTRYLLTAGWKEEGLKLIQVMEESGKDELWDDVTKSLVKGISTGVFDDAESVGTGRNHPVPEPHLAQLKLPLEGVKLPLEGVISAQRSSIERRGHSALANSTLPRAVLGLRRAKPAPSHLAHVLHELQSHSPPRTSLYNRLRKLYVFEDDTHEANQRHLTLLWHHAEIIRSSNQSRHEDAISYFQKYFTWLGLPHHPLKGAPDLVLMEPGRRISQPQYPLVPNIHILTTLLKSLFTTFPSPDRDIPNYLRAHLNLSQSLPPSLRPTSVTSGVYLREISRKSQPTTVLEYMGELEAAGWEMPRQLDVLWSLVKGLTGQGRFEEMSVLWRRMEENGTIKDEARAVLGEMLVERGEYERARDILQVQVEEAVQSERIAARM